MVRKTRQPHVTDNVGAASRSYGYDLSHSLRVEKQPPLSLEVLRRELLLPKHQDIFAISQKAKNFEEAVATIAAMLDIALDGAYEPDALFTMLVEALRSRGTKLNAHELAAGLQEVELVETADEVKLEFAGVTVAPTEAEKVAASAGGYALWMQEQGCKICESKVACLTAKKCLGEESFEEGTKLTS